VADRRIGEFSLGMTQRLGVAGALLGDPEILMFDEPVNGLDADGVRWIRGPMRRLAGEGRTVFVSSHLMSETQITADHLVIIGRGRLIADAPLDELIARSAHTAVKVRSPDPQGLRRLREEPAARGVDVRTGGPGGLPAVGAQAAQVGDLAHRLGVRLHELSQDGASLEQVYLELTGDSVEFADAESPARRKERVAR